MHRIAIGIPNEFDRDFNREDLPILFAEEAFIHRDLLATDQARINIEALIKLCRNLTNGEELHLFQGVPKHISGTLVCRKMAPFHVQQEHGIVGLFEQCAEAHLALVQGIPYLLALGNVGKRCYRRMGQRLSGAEEWL